MKLQDILAKEQGVLRSELRDLKDCQIRFFNLSVTATGLLLGIAVTVASSDQSRGIAYLFPLIIVIPSWWIFFDKATTITRIVGYYRNIEKLILDTHTAKFIGWENALEVFREKQRKKELKLNSNLDEENPIKHILKLLVLNTTHRYWMITYYTFLGLALLSLGLSYSESQANILGYLAALLVLFSAIWNFNVIRHLIGGRYSYTGNEEFWVEILSMEEKNEDDPSTI